MPDLEITFKTETEMRPEERKELERLLVEAFKDDGDPGYDWAQPNIHVLGWKNGRLASYAGILEREILAGGKKMLIAGITDVATRADCLRQGLAKKMVLAAGDYLRTKKMHKFVLLFCNPPLVPFYESCGYRLIDAPLFILSEGRRFRINEIKMTLPLDGSSWPDGEIDLQGLPW